MTMKALLTNPRIPFMRRPLWLAAWFFAVGVGFSRYAFPAPSTAWLSIASFFLLFGLFARNWSPVSRHRSLVFLLAVFCVGGWRETVEIRSREAPDRIRTFLGAREETTVELTGTLEHWPEPALGRVILVISTSRIQMDGWRPVRGRLRLTLPLDRPETLAEWRNLALSPGDGLKLTARVGRMARYNNPGGPDFGDWLDRKGFDASGEAIAIARESSESRKSPFSRVGRLRLAVLERLSLDFQPRTAGLLAAALLGSEHFLDGDWADAFRRSGTFHLLVISGSHFALLAAAFRKLLDRLLKKEWPKAAILLCIVWSYAVLVGHEPPVLRAAVAVTVWQLASLVHRKPDFLNVIGASGLGILAISPEELFGASFQLTFTAVIALAGGAAPLYRTLRRIGAWQPRRGTPYPPAVPRGVRRFAELLFWSEREFRSEQKTAPIRMNLDKSRLAGRLEAVGVGKFNLQNGLRWLFGMTLATGCVQLALLPLEIYNFNRCAPFAVISNLAAELAMTAVMLVGAVYLAASALSLGSPLARLAEFAVSLLVNIAGLGAALPFANHRVPHLETGAFQAGLGFGAGLFILGYAVDRWRPLDRPARRPKFIKFEMIAGFLLILLFGGSTLAPPRRAPAPGVLRVTFLDVGQGDCALVEFPNGQTLLIDSGGTADWGRASSLIKPDAPGIGERVVSRALWARGIRRLDAVIATHPDSDHIQAFSDIAENFPIGAAWHGPVNPADRTFQTFAAAMRRHGTPLRELTAPLELAFGAVKLSIIGPSGSLKTDNDRSLVVKLTYGARSFLFTGDIEAAAEADLLARGGPLGCDVVKAPHHGSKSSSTPGFIRAVGAAHVVFCAPRRSPFGHPHAEVVNRYRELLPAARLWQTGRDGAVTVETDGGWLKAEAFGLKIED